MQFDIAQQMKACEGIEKIEQRNDTGKVRNIFFFWLIFIKFRDKNLIRELMKKTGKKKENNKTWFHSCQSIFVGILLLMICLNKYKLIFAK